MSMIPIPEQQTNLLAQGEGGNAALFFSRMACWTWNEKEKKLEAKYQNGTDHKGKATTDSSIVELGRKINERLSSSKSVLNTIHTRQTDIFKTEAGWGGMVWEFRVRLLSPYVSGLGSGHPTETGMILDRNSGLPYIPASTVKGVLRLACALHIAETEPGAVMPSNKEPGYMEVRDDHTTLRRYFGDIDTGKTDSVRGQLVFLDAFPAEVPAGKSSIIKTDIMNPHFGKYYADEQGPQETENPIPVKFLTVAPVTEFVFRCFTSPLPTQESNGKDAEVYRSFDAKDEQAVIAIFSRAFEKLGFGGKTSIGYGRFSLVGTTTSSHFKSLFEQEAEQRRQEEEEKLYPWRPLLAGLEQAADWGILRQKFLDSKQLQGYRIQQEVGERIKAAAECVRANSQKTWTSERDQQMADWLAPSGVAWPMQEPAQVEPPQTALSADEQQRVDRILGLDDWGQFKNARLIIEELSLPEAEALKQVFNRPKLGVDKKSKNEEKKKAWKSLEAHLRKMK